MRSQRGIGLIMGMLILTILSLLGLGLMTSATLETRIQSNARSSPVFTMPQKPDWKRPATG